MIYFGSFLLNLRLPRRIHVEKAKSVKYSGESATSKTGVPINEPWFWDESLRRQIKNKFNVIYY